MLTVIRVSELTYPSEDKPTYCHDCGEHIRDNDLFGRFRGQFTILYCASCFGTYHNKEMEIVHPTEEELQEWKDFLKKGTLY